MTLLLSENAELQTQLDAARKQLSTSESKREIAVQSQQSLLSKSREYKKALHSAETLTKKQATQLSIAKEENEAVVQEKLDAAAQKHKVSVTMSPTVYISVTPHNIYLCFRIFIQEVLRVRD